MSTYAHRLGTLCQNFTSVNGAKGVTSYQKKKKNLNKTMQEWLELHLSTDYWKRDYDQQL